ncbi:hypothetical protein GCM10010149_68580 [Nonomuraea roseoviolacea subsp. roseoviolacea]
MVRSRLTRSTPHAVSPRKSWSRASWRTQATWAYCEWINGQVEQRHDPAIADGYGWRFLRAARSRLTNPRPRETAQHRSMRDAIVETSGLAGHLDQAIEALREAGRQ